MKSHDLFRGSRSMYESGQINMSQLPKRLKTLRLFFRTKANHMSIIFV